MPTQPASFPPDTLAPASAPPALGHTETDTAAGDALRRRARRAGLYCLIALPVTLWLFARAFWMWSLVEPLNGAAFIAAALLMGGVLAVAPLLTVWALLAAVWHGAESVFRPRSRPTPMADRFIVGGSLLVWFAPALGLLGKAAVAIIVGKVAFSRPTREYWLASDPIAFWQSIGFFLIVGVALAYPAWLYWRAKFRGAASRHRHPASLT